MAEQLSTGLVWPRLPDVDDLGDRVKPQEPIRRLSSRQVWLWYRCPRHGVVRAGLIPRLGTQVCSACQRGAR